MRKLFLVLMFAGTYGLAATDLDDFIKDADLSIEQKVVLGVIQGSGVYLGVLEQQNLKLLMQRKNEITNSLLSYQQLCEDANNYNDDKNKIFIEKILSENEIKSYTLGHLSNTIGLIKKTHNTDDKKLSTTPALFSRQGFSKRTAESALMSLLPIFKDANTVQKIDSIRKRGGLYYMKGTWGPFNYYYAVSRDHFTDVIAGKKKCEDLGKNACVVVRDEEKTYIKWMQDEDKTACTLINSFVSEVAKHIYLIRNYHTNYYARNWQTARYLMNVALPVFVDKIGGRPDAGFDNESTKYITELRTKLIEKNSGNGLNRIVDADSSEELNSKVGAVNINIDQIKNIFNSLFTN